MTGPGTRDGDRDGGAGFGVYFHVPFCVSRCDYCAFATWTDRWHLASRYVDACVEASERLIEGSRRATSVFFGGGTPSLLDPGELARLVSSVRLAPGAEVTVECNPETVDADKLGGYRQAGVTRLSFGVQSMSDSVLAALGRHHDPSDVQRAVSAAGIAGFAGCYSVDLIFGAVGESLADWRATVEAVLGLDPAPAHVSAYALTVEPGTPLGRDSLRHPDPDDQADKYLLAEEMLTAAGYRWYEISNWALPGAECSHNRLYWQQGEYLGIGCSAHSHARLPDGRSRRWWNLRTPERYVTAVEAGGSGEAGEEVLDAKTRARERLELALRTRDGVPESALAGWERDERLACLVAPSAAGRLVLTVEGRLLANEVALRLADP